MGSLLRQHRAAHFVGFALEQGNQLPLLVFDANVVVAGAATAVQEQGFRGMQLPETIVGAAAPVPAIAAVAAAGVSP